MDTIDSLIRRGYRVYKIKMRLTSTLKHFFRVKNDLHVEYHDLLKVIIVKDVKGKSEL